MTGAELDSLVIHRAALRGATVEIETVMSRPPAGDGPLPMALEVVYRLDDGVSRKEPAAITFDILTTAELTAGPRVDAMVNAMVDAVLMRPRQDRP